MLAIKSDSYTRLFLSCFVPFQTKPLSANTATPLSLLNSPSHRTPKSFREFPSSSPELSLPVPELFHNKSKISFFFPVVYFLNVWLSLSLSPFQEACIVGNKISISFSPPLPLFDPSCLILHFFMFAFCFCNIHNFQREREGGKLEGYLPFSSSLFFWKVGFFSCFIQILVIRNSTIFFSDYCVFKVFFFFNN